MTPEGEGGRHSVTEWHMRYWGGKGEPKCHVIFFRHFKDIFTKLHLKKSRKSYIFVKWKMSHHTREGPRGSGEYHQMSHGKGSGSVKVTKMLIWLNCRQYPNAIWWIGLRLTEDCQCIGSSLDSNANGRSLEATKTSFEVNLVLKMNFEC